MKPNWYERTLLPWLIDSACSHGTVRRQREKVVPLAHGRVLEIGIGTGLNMRHYDKSRIRSLTDVHSHHDHRIAMACAVGGLKANSETIIEEAQAVRKSTLIFIMF